MHGAAKTGALAPRWDVNEWIGADDAPTLESLQGRVIALHFFQMLCPGCVVHGLPQAQRLRQTFDPAALAVIGMHSVFEHHAVMKPEALRVFLREWRVSFPVAVDAHDAGAPVPRTMRAYGVRGTPSLVLIDRRGAIRYHDVKPIDDLELGGRIGALVAESPTSAAEQVEAATGNYCDADGCYVAG